MWKLTPETAKNNGPIFRFASIPVNMDYVILA
jgi:hypothetical protein